MIVAVLILLGITVFIGYLRAKAIKAEITDLRARVVDLEMQIRELDPGLLPTDWQELADKEPGQ